MGNDKGYRVKINGVYEDGGEGWQCWELMGLTIMNPVCPVCKQPWKEGDQVTLRPGGITVHAACIPDAILEETSTVRLRKKP